MNISNELKKCIVEHKEALSENDINIDYMMDCPYDIDDDRYNDIDRKRGQEFYNLLYKECGIDWMAYTWFFTTAFLFRDQIKNGTLIIPENIQVIKFEPPENDIDNWRNALQRVEIKGIKLDTLIVQCIDTMPRLKEVCVSQGSDICDIGYTTGQEQLFKKILHWV